MEAAPLIGIPEAPVPDGGRAFWLQGADGARLRAALFPVSGRARGSVVLSPGRTEPLEKYFETIEELRGRGFTVLTHDWRGQGLSARALPDRLKGHARGFEAFLSDHRLMLDQLAADLPKPWIGLAHSMGAGLLLLALARGERRIDTAVLTAPLIGIYAVRRWPPGLPRLIARTACALGLSGVYVGRAVDAINEVFADNILTHDRRRFDIYAAQLRACPDLGIGGVTWGWLDYALSAGAILSGPARGTALRLPFTIVAAGEEKLVMNAPARALAEAAANGRYVEIPNSLHEILMETDPVRAMFWREFDARCAGLSSPNA